MSEKNIKTIKLQLNLSRLVLANSLLTVILELLFSFMLNEHGHSAFLCVPWLCTFPSSKGLSVN